MPKSLRIRVDEALEKMDDDLLLVCAYRDKEKCEQIHIDGSIPLPEFEAKVEQGEVPKDRPVVFY